MTTLVTVKPHGVAIAVEIDEPAGTPVWRETIPAESTTESAFFLYGERVLTLREAPGAPK